MRGRSQRRFSVAALACYKHGERSRLIYRPKRHLDHKRGGRRSFTWADYRDLLIAAHQQLGAPIVLVWDNLNVHKDRRLRQFINTHDWITCYFLPAYAPDLNPVEGIWSLLRRSSQANTAFTDPDHLISTLRHGLRHIQYRSNLIDGCLAETGLTMTTSRRKGQVTSDLVTVSAVIAVGSIPWMRSPGAMAAEVCAADRAGRCWSGEAIMVAVLHCCTAGSNHPEVG